MDEDDDLAAGYNASATAPRQKEETETVPAEETDIAAVGQRAAPGQLARIYQGGVEQTGNGEQLGGGAAQGAYQQQMERLYNALPPAIKGQYLLQHMQLSQVENVRLQKLQNAVGAIKANTYLSDEEKAHALMIAQTNINPLVLRQAKAKQMAMEMQNQEHQSQLEAVQRNKLFVQQDDAQNSEKGIAAHEMPHAPGEHVYTQVDPKTWLRHPVPGMPGSKEYEAAQTRKDALAATAANHNLEREKFEHEKEAVHAKEDRAHHSKLLSEAIDKVDAVIAKGKNEAGGFNPDPWKGKEGEMRDVMIRKAMADHNLPVDTEKYMTDQAAKRKGSMTPPPPTQAKAPPNPAAEATQQHLSRAANKAAEANDFDARSALWQIRDAVAEHGSIDKMPKEVFDRVAALHYKAKKYLGK